MAGSSEELAPGAGTHHLRARNCQRALLRLLAHSPTPSASTSAVTTLASEYLPLMVTPPSSPMDTCRVYANGEGIVCLCVAWQRHVHAQLATHGHGS